MFIVLVDIHVFITLQQYIGCEVVTLLLLMSEHENPSKSLEKKEKTQSSRLWPTGVKM